MVYFARRGGGSVLRVRGTGRPKQVPAAKSSERKKTVPPFLGADPPRRPFFFSPFSTPFHPAVFLCEIDPCQFRNAARSIQKRRRRTCSPACRRMKRALSKATASPVPGAQRSLNQPAVTCSP